MWYVRAPADLRDLQLGSLLVPTEQWGPALQQHRQRQQPQLDQLRVRYNARSDTACIIDDAEKPANGRIVHSGEDTHIIGQQSALGFSSPGDSYI